MENVQVLVFLTAGLFAFITGYIIYFVILYRNKQFKNKKEQEALQARFRQELLKTRIEMQDQTLGQISREIHDNITQVLSFVKLNLAMANTDDEQQRTDKIAESRELVAQVITDLRDLSKSMSFEHISRQGLVKMVETEVNRLNKSGLVKAHLQIKGEIVALGEQRELVLFRILQESINNAMKHAVAKDYNFILEYIPQLFTLTFKDNGKGFSPEDAKGGGGSGLINIENRAALIGAVATINSAPGQGCCIKVSLNPTKETPLPEEWIVK